MGMNQDQARKNLMNYFGYTAKDMRALEIMDVDILDFADLVMETEVEVVFNF
jgi:hypothetical protein